MPKPWYETLSSNPIIRAQALAAAGTLVAAGWRPGMVPENILQHALRSSPLHPTGWTYPSVEQISQLPSEQELAELWQALGAQYQVAPRLVVNLAGAENPAVYGSVDALRSLTRSLTYPWYGEPGNLPPGAISSVFFTTTGELPQRQGMSRYVAALTEAMRVRDGHFSLPYLNGPPGLVVLSEPVAGATTDHRFHGVEGLVDPMGRVLIAGDKIHAPIAVVQMGRDSIEPYLTALQSAADTLPMDTAVFRALRKTNERLGYNLSPASTPVVITPSVTNIDRRPTDEARGLRPSERRRIPAAAPPSPPDDQGVYAEEGRRFTDLTIYEGWSGPSDQRDAAKQLSEKKPLVLGQRYTLEVAIRQKRTGVAAKRRSPHPVKPPRRKREAVTIFVLATRRWDGLTINEPFQTLKWPFDSDSSSAVFHLEFDAEYPESQSEGNVDIRLYSDQLDLLDVLTLWGVAVSPERAADSTKRIQRRQLHWPNGDEGIPEIYPTGPARIVSIDVKQISATNIEFAFVFVTRQGKLVRIAVPTHATVSDIENLLVQIRDFWTDLVITSYSNSLTVPAATYEANLERLAEFGRRAWQLLFGTGEADQKGASETLGELLEKLKSPPGSCIQITYGRQLSNFVFPWSLMYPPWTAGPADAMAFWGARYEIEQVRDAYKYNGLECDPIEIAPAIDPLFGESEKQEVMFQAFVLAAGKKIKMSPTITSFETLDATLTKPDAAHVFYFFCHGYTPPRVGVTGPAIAAIMKEKIEALGADSKERQVWETWFNLTSKMGNESWMYIGSEVSESKLAGRKFFQRKRPIVFLNMCNSANVLPSMSTGLVHLFLNHNASTVIGTECPMTSIFAHEFSKEVFTHLLNGKRVGLALLLARQAFLASDKRNPLGLAYTLYGRGVTRLGVQTAES